MRCSEPGPACQAPVAGIANPTRAAGEGVGHGFFSLMSEGVVFDPLLILRETGMHFHFLCRYRRHSHIFGRV
jgi:hypothetical protein